VSEASPRVLSDEECAGVPHDCPGPVQPDSERANLYSGDSGQFSQKHGFSDFKKAVTMTFAFSPASNKDSESQMPPPQPVERFLFSDISNTQNFQLDQGSLSFQSTKYEVFERFATELTKGLQMVDKMVGG
jgi:hypothetical protein